MRSVDILEAKADLLRLVEAAAQGEAFVIAEDGRPLVKVVPVVPPPTTPTLPRIGFMRGEFSVPDDFDRMYQEEIERMFYGEEE